MFNFIKKLFNEPEKYTLEITKSGYDVLEEDCRDELFNQCPVCGHQNKIDGGTTDGTWSYYRCQNPNCKAEWRVKE